MKVLLVNGSPHKDGCTNEALLEIKKTLEENGIDIVVANELLPERARFYEFLHPKTTVITGDITKDEIFNRWIGQYRFRVCQYAS